MWELDHKESWVVKNWCFWTVVLKKALESLLNSKDIKPVNPKLYPSWIFIGSTDAAAEAPIVWLHDVKSWLIRKEPWCWERFKARGEGDDRGWHGWMASPTQQTWAWASPRRWWTGKPGMLQSMGSQRVGHHWATEHHHHLHDNPILCPLLWESDIFVVFIFLSCIFKLFSQLFPSACKSD